jgi:hypothetical protein
VHLEEAREIQIAHCSPSGDLRDIGSITAAFGGLKGKKVFLQPKGSLDGYRRSHFRLGDLKNTDSTYAAKRK